MNPNIKSNQGQTPGKTDIPNPNMDFEGGVQTTNPILIENSDTINPFVRRGSIQRTPPKNASHSLSVLDFDTLKEPNGK